MKRILFVILTIVMLSALTASCGDKVTTTPVATTTTAAPVTTTPTATPAATTIAPPVTTTATAATKDYLYASAMADFFYNINAVQNYYGDGLTSVSTFGVGSGTATVSTSNYRVVLVGYRQAAFEDQQNKIPPELSEPLPPDGSMAAPPGACPAAAEPYEKFITEGGDIVTPDLLAEKDVVTLPVSYVNASESDPGSLKSLMDRLVPMNDRRLGTPEGWNTLLWDKLKAMQVPAESLMDYQMWTLSNDLEADVVSAFRQSLADQGVPDMVLDAFDQSDNTGWYAKTPPTAEDALAQMDIHAKLTGSVSGIVHEWRDFSIPSLGADPVFGDQHGDGNVTIEAPGMGKAECSVDILFDQFDELGRAINGTVTATPIGIDGYKVVFNYKPDGTKEGQIIDITTGDILGYLTMTTDAEKFTNYVSVKEGTELKLPEITPIPAVTTFQ
jgi:hypothetical protein